MISSEFSSCFTPLFCQVEKKNNNRLKVIFLCVSLTRTFLSCLWSLLQQVPYLKYIYWHRFSQISIGIHSARSLELRCYECKHYGAFQGSGSLSCIYNLCQFPEHGYCIPLWFLLHPHVIKVANALSSSIWCSRMHWFRSCELSLPWNEVNEVRFSVV